MKGIEVRNDVRGSFTNPANSVSNVKQSLAETPDLDWLTGAIIHDSFHPYQFERGLSFEGEKNGEKNALTREKEASAFAADVAERIGLSTETIERLRRDAREGHIFPTTSPYTRPPKKKMVW
jgi:hypothetical protein